MTGFYSFNCRVCNGLVANDATSCPHCGHRAQLEEKREAAWKASPEGRAALKEKEEQRKKWEQSEEWRKQGRCPNCGNDGRISPIITDSYQDMNKYMRYHMRCKRCDHTWL